MKRNYVKKHHLCFGLGKEGLETLGIVTFDDDTTEAIVINKKYNSYKVGDIDLSTMECLYDFISNKMPDKYYKEREQQNEGENNVK